MMGYKTSNIDRIAKEVALFTDWYGPQSCTAGRATFITGQVGFRTGMLEVGLPGAKESLQGGYRVPSTIRWPGVIKPGTVLKDAAHKDMFPTLLAVALWRVTLM